MWLRSTKRTDCAQLALAFRRSQASSCLCQSRGGGVRKEGGGSDATCHLVARAGETFADRLVRAHALTSFVASQVIFDYTTPWCTYCTRSPFTTTNNSSTRQNNPSPDPMESKSLPYDIGLPSKRPCLRSSAQWCADPINDDSSSREEINEGRGGERAPHAHPWMYAELPQLAQRLSCPLPWTLHYF